MRRPLSNAEEEDAFQRMDDACDACAAGLKPFILRRWQEQSQGLNRATLALALMVNSPGGVRAAASRIRPMESREMRFIKPKAVKKAKKLSPEEADFIEGAVEEGIQLGLETLPAKIRGKVDVEAASALARRRLSRGIFRRNMTQFDEAMRGLERIVEASRAPAMAVLKDAERLASMFGINSRQADTIAREVAYFVAQKRDADAIRRAMARRIQQALEANAEMLGQSLAQEAISTAQQALYETARKQGLLNDEQHMKEWISRRDDVVCPRCDAFDGKRVPVDEMFVSDTGEKAFQPGIHPRCRCRTRLVTQRAAARPRRTQSRAD